MLYYPLRSCIAVHCNILRSITS